MATSDFKGKGKGNTIQMDDATMEGDAIDQRMIDADRAEIEASRQELAALSQHLSMHDYTSRERAVVALLP